MRTTISVTVAIGVLMASSPARAVYREPTTPPPAQGEQIPGKTLKLDPGSDTPPSAVEKKPKEKEPERTVTHQRRRSPEDAPPRRDQGMSPDAGRALGTAVEIGAVFALGRALGGMGGHDMKP
jgi:hypothetical protein